MESYISAEDFKRTLLILQANTIREGVLVAGQVIKMPFDELPNMERIDLVTEYAYSEVRYQPIPSVMEQLFGASKDCHFCECYEPDKPAKDCQCECHE